MISGAWVGGGHVNPPAAIAVLVLRGVGGCQAAGALGAVPRSSTVAG